MAGIVRTGAKSVVTVKTRLAELPKGERMDPKNNDVEDMMKHVQALRGERPTFSPPEQTVPTAPPIVQPPLPPPGTTQFVASVTPPPAVELPPMRQMGLTPEQTNHLTAIGLPLNPQQMQWLMAGYAPMQILSPQQQMALGLASPQVFPQPTTPGPSLYQQFEQQVNQVGVKNVDIVDKKKTSIKFGIIGAGQGGSRIAEAFYQLGYPTCVVNTAQHDLQNINIPEDNKLLLNVGIGGAGKDLQEGFDAATDYAEDILDLMKNTFPRDVEHIIVCCGGGGGSGSGGLPKVIDMARIMNVPVGVVFTIPKDSEGSKVKENAFNRLRMLDNKMAAGELSPLILIDNNKIHEMHVGVSTAKFWRVANAQITGLFHLFNVLSAQNSAYASFDPADYRTIIKSKGCLLFGSTTVQDVSRKTAVAKALRENVGKGLLAEGFDLTLSKIAGVVVTGSQSLMEDLPQENIDAAVECLERMVGGGTLHHGIYVENVPNLTVYTLIGGLPLPDERINKLIKTP